MGGAQSNQTIDGFQGALVQRRFESAYDIIRGES